MTPPTARPTLTLSPDVMSGLTLPLKLSHLSLVTAGGYLLARIEAPHLYIWEQQELAAFIAGLLNAALLPAAPAPAEPERRPGHDYVDGSDVESANISVAEELARR